MNFHSVEQLVDYIHIQKPYLKSTMIYKENAILFFDENGLPRAKLNGLLSGISFTFEEYGLQLMEKNDEFYFVCS